MNILYVDDRSDNREVMKDMLSFAGYHVETLNDPSKAIAYLKEHDIQLLLTDWMMPEMSGLDLVSAVRAEFTDKYFYIVVISAKSQPADRVMALESGADDFISRPFTPPELMARLAIGRRIVTLENSLKKQNLELARAKQEWEATTDSIANLVCLIDSEARILRVNGTAARWGLKLPAESILTGLPDLLRLKFVDFAAALEEHWPRAYQRLMAGEEYEFEAEDYRTGYFFVTQFEPIKGAGDPDHRVRSFAAVSIQDITERKKLELELEEEHEKVENLLLNMLPKSVAERLKQGTETIAEHFDMVTVLFADLVDFTPMTSRIDPGELIDLLNSVFSAFDMLADRHHVEKIKTIGDAYMVVGGLPEPVSDHADRIARIALAMQRAIEQINAAYGYQLQLRIGMHSGPVVAGVIGMKKLTYDLWGETVNTASRMESNGLKGCIQSTESTYHLLKSDYEFEERGIIEVKGIGPVRTYLLRGVKASSS